MKKILVADNVTKIYGLGTKHPFKALKGIHMEMNEGDFVCVMGPSGSGKSTLLNTLSTIDMPTNGHVYIDGKDVKDMGEVEVGKFRYENLGFIFQEFNLLDTLTIFQNIAVPLSLAGVNKNEIKERVEKTAKQLGVDSLLEKYPDECSGGQRQRVAITRALVTNPKIIIADEPTGNLDSQNSHELLALFKRLNDEMGVSILMVTHDPLIASYSTKLLYLRDGLIDAELLRGDMDQKEYFYKITDLSSSSTQQLFL